MFTWIREYRHRRYQRLLSEYLDGRPTGAARIKLEAHLRGCAACQEDLESLRDTVQALRHLPQAPVPHSFVLTEVPAPRHVLRPRPVLVRSMQVSSAVAALLLALLVVGDVASLFPTATPTASPADTTALRVSEVPDGPQGPAAAAGPATTPTPAPRPARTPAPDVDTSKQAESTFSVEVSGAPQIVLTPSEEAAPAPAALPPEPPRSALATALLALKVSLGSAVALLAGATVYLTWRRRRQQAA